MAKIGELAVYVVDKSGDGHWLLPGDTVPAGIVVGEHALAHDAGEDPGQGSGDPAPHPRTRKPRTPSA